MSNTNTIENIINSVSALDTKFETMSKGHSALLCELQISVEQLKVVVEQLVQKDNSKTKKKTEPAATETTEGGEASSSQAGSVVEATKPATKAPAKAKVNLTTTLFQELWNKDSSQAFRTEFLSDEEILNQRTEKILKMKETNPAGYIKEMGKIVYKFLSLNKATEKYKQLWERSQNMIKSPQEAELANEPVTPTQ